MELILACFSLGEANLELIENSKFMILYNLIVYSKKILHEAPILITAALPPILREAQRVRRSEHSVLNDLIFPSLLQCVIYKKADVY